MKSFYLVLVFIITSLYAISASVPVFAEKGRVGSASSSIPLPSGLSKDTQFVIYYMDKRFSEIQREMDKRFSEIQREMDKRFEQVDKRFEQIDKRFEQVDRRFEDINERFREMLNFMWILAGIFTTLTAVVIGFAYWDRRTIIRKARDEAIERIEREGRLQDFIRALRAFAEKNSEFAKILKSFNLL